MTKQETSEPRWQSIDSAPKDGTEILAVKDGKVELFRYVPKATAPYWTSVGKHRLTRFEREEPPTHWMPLPSPPESK